MAGVHYPGAGRLGVFGRCGCSGWRRAGHTRSAPAPTRRCSCRWPGPVRSSATASGSAWRAVPMSSPARPTSPTCRGTRGSVCRARPGGGSRSRPPGRRSAWPRGTAPRRGSPSNCAAPGRARGGCTTSACPACSSADRLIACEVITPAGNWSSYPPHKHDEDRPGESVLEEIYYFQIGTGPDRAWRGLPARLRDGRPASRPARRGQGSATSCCPARLPRAVDGGARLPHVLPERDGRAGRAGLAGLRRPGARLDQEHLAGPGDRSPAAVTGRTAMTATVRLTVGQAVVRFLAAQRSERDGIERPAVRRLLRHLRPRQPRRDRPGAARSRTWPARRTALLPGQERAGDGAHRRGVRPDAQPAVDAGRAPRRSALARRTWSPVRRWLPSTGCRSCCSPRDVFATRVATPVLQELEHPAALDVSVNDAFRPVSRFFDRVWRPSSFRRPCLAPCGC